MPPDVVYDTWCVVTIVYAGPRLGLLGLGVRVPVGKGDVSMWIVRESEGMSGEGQIGAKDKMIVSQQKNSV